MQQIALSDETFARLQRHAVPLIDTVESVIKRALDALEEGSNATSTPRTNASYIANSPPDLSFTSVEYAAVDGVKLPASETFWNNILLATIRAAAGHGAVSSQIASKILINHVMGVKEDGGYRYVREAGLSVQGQDANGAWKATQFLARAFNVKVQVSFNWQNNPKAANPGQAGVMAVNTESIFD